MLLIGPRGRVEATSMAFNYSSEYRRGGNVVETMVGVTVAQVGFPLHFECRSEWETTTSRRERTKAGDDTGMSKEMVPTGGPHLSVADGGRAARANCVESVEAG